MPLVNDLLALQADMEAKAANPKRCEKLDDMISFHYANHWKANSVFDNASLKALQAIVVGDFPKGFVK